MNAQQRYLCQRVVAIYATVEPLERHVRRTDWTLAVGAVATVGMFAFFGYGLTGWWSSFYIALAAVSGFVFGRGFERIASRRRAFEALKAANEEASLELAVDDDDE